MASAPLTRPSIEGVELLNERRIFDERGSFSRLFSEEQIKKPIVQINHSASLKRGTLRGLHYQIPPFEEIKVVRCMKGALYDVVLDIRENSPTYGSWFAETLTPENGVALVVPEGCAHGFLTLEDNTEILYFVTAPYSKEHERGIRFDDPRFEIEWPFTPLILSEKDRSYG